MMENTTMALDDGNSSVRGVSGTNVDVLTLALVGADGFICLFGLFGNVLIIYVIRRRWSSSKSQAVTTNTFILNLSVTDTLFLLGLPMIMTTVLVRRWVFGAVLCRVYYAMTCVNMFTGTFTVMLMSIERFIVVWWPVACNRLAS